jgi:XTP/dITP diphosphohydrolase
MRRLQPWLLIRPEPEMARLVLATHNPHKVRELREILTPLVPGLAGADVVGAADLAAPMPLEDEVTFAGNALLKARALARFSGLVAVADDSGLEVDVLGGAPGVFSARWAGGHGDDEANLRLLLDQLADVPPKHRGAQFTCAAAVAAPDGREHVVMGRMRGVLIHAPRGSGGFGYDPIFVAVGQDRTNSELTPEEKNAISHRAEAFVALAPTIAEYLT